MEEQVRLELFTVHQVRDWLEHGVTERGLSEKLIARTRAWAIVNNPYATDDLNIISAIFVNDEVAAYTYLFPDEHNGQRIYWNTTLYCAPKFEGRAYAAIVMGQFCELYGEHYFDLDAVKESVENLKFIGLQVDYVDQYVLCNKSIRTNTLRGKFATLIQRIQIACHSKEKQLRHRIAKANYHLEYVNFVDDETYAFIRIHAADNLFLRTKEMFNWILTYPFMQESPLVYRVERDTKFSATRCAFRYHAVRVLVDNRLVGFYILNESKEVLYLNYLYYDKDFAETAYLSIAEHVLLFRAPKFFTSDIACADFVAQYKLYPKHEIYHKSFSYPQPFVYDKTKFIQAGDGDNLT